MADEKKNKDKNKQDFEQLKRKATDFVLDLHEHKLAIPAGILLVLILAAMFLMPKSATPPAPVQTAPAAQQTKTLDLKKVSSISLVSDLPLNATPRFSNMKGNPFSGKGGADVECRVAQAGPPKVVACMIADLLIFFECAKDSQIPYCNGKSSGSSGSTGGAKTEVPGGSGGGGTLPEMPGDGGGGGGGDSGETKTTIYVADIEYDGKTYKGVESREQLPEEGAAVVFYAGPNDSGKKAIFMLGDNVSMQGAELDEDLGTFQLSEGDEVILTDSNDVVHNLLLKNIRKVTK